MIDIEELKNELMNNTLTDYDQMDHLLNDTVKALEQQQARIEELEKASEWISVEKLTEHLKLALNYIENIETVIDGIGGYTEEQIYENIPECDFDYKTAKSLLALPKPPEGKS
jgi:phosphomevalonate kinase